MALLLADKRVTIFILAQKPADPENLTVEDFEGAINAGDRFFEADTYLRPTGSDVVNYALLNQNNRQAWGASNYEGQFNLGRFFDPDTGLVDSESDDLWPILKIKGSEQWAVERSGPAWDAPIEAGQEVSLYGGTTDTPQPPQTRDDYIRRVIPFAVTEAYTDQVVAA